MHSGMNRSHTFQESDRLPGGDTVEATMTAESNLWTQMLLANTTRNAESDTNQKRVGSTHVLAVVHMDLAL